ncbi:MAG: hypothetical protein ACLUD2_12645 [Clostridium sp.]
MESSEKLNQQNLTILLTTHYMEEAESLCDRVGFMCRGVLRETDTPRHMIEVLGRYAVDETKPDGVKMPLFFTEGGSNPLSVRLSDMRHHCAIQRWKMSFWNTVGQSSMERR